MINSEFKKDVEIFPLHIYLTRNPLTILKENVSKNQNPKSIYPVCNHDKQVIKSAIKNRFIDLYFGINKR